MWPRSPPYSPGPRNKRRKPRNPRDHRSSVSPPGTKTKGCKGDPAGASATMAYVERGVVKNKRTVWRLSIIPDFFKAVVNFIRMFILTMFSVEKTDSYKKGYGGGKKWDGGPGGGGPGGGPYGGGGGGGGGPRGPRTLSDLRSNDQSSLPACGSCCG